MEKIYSKPASSKYLDNYDKIFKNPEEPEKLEDCETRIEILNRLENLGDKLFEVREQGVEEKKDIIKKLKSEKHITPGNKKQYKRPNFFNRIFGLFRSKKVK